MLTINEEISLSLYVILGNMFLAVPNIFLM